jgi:hypothetical protein
MEPMVKIVMPITASSRVNADLFLVAWMTM